MTDKANFHPYFFVCQLGNTGYSRHGDDHVVAVGKVIDQCHYRAPSGRAGDKSVAIRHTYSIELSCSVRIHRRNVIEPLKNHVYVGFLKPTLFDPNLPSNPTGPVAVTNSQRLSMGRP